MFRVRIEADTIFNDRRITTVVVRYPWILHHRVLAHRVFCRNVVSPPSVQAVETDPFIPLDWGTANASVCQLQWKHALDVSLVSAQQLVSHLKVPPNAVEPLLSPFSYVTCLITATEWANFFKQRIQDDDAHMRKLAELLLAAMERSVPVERPLHMPYLTPDEREVLMEQYMRDGVHSENVRRTAAVSGSRCARGTFAIDSSPVKHDREVDLAAELVSGSGCGDWSPFEHFAVSYVGMYTACPYRGWKTFRSFQVNENLPGHVGEYLCLKK